MNTENSDNYKNSKIEEAKSFIEELDPEVLDYYRNFDSIPIIAQSLIRSISSECLESNEQHALKNNKNKINNFQDVLKKFGINNKNIEYSLSFLGLNNSI